MVRKLEPSKTWNPMVEDALRVMELYHISRIRVIRRFYPLLLALVKRWRSETHTFVLSVGEFTVILEDLAHISSLLIDGEFVSGWTDNSHDFLKRQHRNFRPRTRCHWHGFAVSETQSHWTLWTIFRNTSDARFSIFWVRPYLWKSQRHMSTRSIYRCSAFSPDPHLQLGAACLAHLYRALCRASWYDTKEMDDLLNLLFVWAWERMPCIAPVSRQYLPVTDIAVAWR
ncbi:hypothetical protein Ahy_B07g087414 [Arachis hypogaea]|uniref:Aminotransferase-like plant mobile domain-containing protein n=1 Tax=Arachis hypogaea TaxID=3818 RepID=A0A444YC38_ARAHY|nr:hypothetical protein Ahy_B07g087414 [Arachis hypogaea]